MGSEAEVCIDSSAAAGRVWRSGSVDVVWDMVGEMFALVHIG